MKCQQLRASCRCCDTQHLLSAPTLCTGSSTDLGALQVLLSDTKPYSCPEPNPFAEEEDGKRLASIAYKCARLLAQSMAMSEIARDA